MAARSRWLAGSPPTSPSTALLEPGEPVVALVSGGADSLCLWGVLRELGYPVEALHVEHGLRGPSGPRRRRALRRARRHRRRRSTSTAGQRRGARPRGPLRRRPRARRPAASIATGHTLSDQAETVLYRLVRSSGVRALPGDASRAPATSSGRFCALTAAETREWCAGGGARAARVDDTNADTRLRRNLIRHEVMPALRRVHPGAEVNLARIGGAPGRARRAAATSWPASTSRPHLDLDRPGRAAARRCGCSCCGAAAERAAGRPLRLPRALTDRLEAMARAAGARASSGSRSGATSRRCATARTLAFGRRRGTRYPPPSHERRADRPSSTIR